jgi:hypothetical protein
MFVVTMEEVIDILLTRLKHAERRALHTRRVAEKGLGTHNTNAIWARQQRLSREWGTVAALTLAIDTLRSVKQ